MASGRKNYFRHSFFARNDMKLRLFRDSIGIGFYFYFFSLLELCGESSCDELQDNYEFHDSIIRNLWGVNLKKSERVACVMHAVGLLFFEKRQKSFYFEIPNLSKYLGKYTNKIETNTSNKRKEKKIKENKRKEKNTDIVFDIDALYNNYPRKMGKKKGMERLKKIITTQQKYDDFLKAVKNYNIHCTDEETEQKYIKLFSTFTGEYEDWIESKSILDESERLAICHKLLAKADIDPKEYNAND